MKYRAGISTQEAWDRIPDDPNKGEFTNETWLEYMHGLNHRKRDLYKKVKKLC